MIESLCYEEGEKHRNSEHTRRVDTHFATELGFIEQNRLKALEAFCKSFERMCDSFSASSSLFVSLRARKCENLLLFSSATDDREKKISFRFNLMILFNVLYAMCAGCVRWGWMKEKEMKEMKEEV